ncbi:MAG: tautomerase family protein [Proteobacteria bacterium]|nr:tautomerase family protein [Pseudomonadota bacterium]
MPLVTISIRKGKDGHYKKALLDAVHEALVLSLKVPQDDRFQRLVEFDSEHFEFPSHYTEDHVTVEVKLFEGRSLDAKRAFYAILVDTLHQRLGLAKTDIFIVVQDIPLDNWGIRGGIPASEVDLGFKIDV